MRTESSLLARYQAALEAKTSICCNRGCETCLAGRLRRQATTADEELFSKALHEDTARKLLMREASLPKPA